MSFERKAGRRWMFLALASVLVLGASLGILGDRLVLAADPPEPSAPVTGEIWFDCSRQPEPRSQAERALKRAEHVQKIDAELALEPAQEAAIESLLEEHGNLSRVFWDDTRERYCERLQTIRDDVREMLTPRQLELFEARIDRIDEEMRRKHQKSDSPRSR
ncbi:MAG: DUF1109 domain-containing protein [Acidobacteria bacterium]|nr:MAG: DUF1109 domain-containing protein [Acidobacteriota bacterium]REK04351.1 MAG: DUF1109 domain-containing protein [Acidobacteriota bacterium]